MKRVFYDLIAYMRLHNNEFTSRDLKTLLNRYGYSTTEANIMHNLYSFLQLADRRHTAIVRKRVGGRTYKLYNISDIVLQDMIRRLDSMYHCGCWIQIGLQRTNPQTGITINPRMENGMEMLLF